MRLFPGRGAPVIGACGALRQRLRNPPPACGEPIGKAVSTWDSDPQSSPSGHQSCAARRSTAAENHTVRGFSTHSLGIRLANGFLLAALRVAVPSRCIHAGLPSETSTPPYLVASGCLRTHVVCPQMSCPHFLGMQDTTLASRLALLCASHSTGSAWHRTCTSRCIERY